MPTIIISDQVQKPYGEWLTECLMEFGKRNLSALCVAAIDADTGETLTGYYDCNVQDKALLSSAIHADAMLDVMKANAGAILDAADDTGEEESG